ncbi:hypothetical protein Vi05172_g3613 [Venturia inaequalis]|nr:hypothetical protein Vi05172_g3613 [Venturia inaequalis]
MLHLIDFTALDKFIDKTAEEQADPSLKNQDHSYLSHYIYDLAMNRNWETLRDECFQQMITCSDLFGDLASKLDSQEAACWFDDIIYILDKWNKAFKWRKEEYKRVCRIRPVKKSPTKVESQPLPGTNITPDAAVPQATLVDEGPKRTLKRSREEMLEERCDVNRPCLEAVMQRSSPFS